MGRRDRGPPKGGLIRMGIRGIAGSVGLVSESIKAHKEGNQARSEDHISDLSDPQTDLRGKDGSDGKIDIVDGPPPSYSMVSPDSKVDQQNQSLDEKGNCKLSNGAMYESSQYEIKNESELEESLEDEWKLDDAQDEMFEEPPEYESLHEPNELENAFLHKHPVSTNVKPLKKGKLPLPVVLPQRRPRNRSRGFVRAYAPMLEECGIDQATWLTFLDTFQKSTAANPWLNAINMASFATMFIPHGFGTLVDFAIQQVTSIAIELQGRERTNGFLQKINDGFFRPRGLYCLVMTWNPESTHRVEQLNIVERIDLGTKPANGLSNLPSKYRVSDGNSYGQWDFPEVAPLVFPALDQLAARMDSDGIKKKNRMAQGMTFVANYWDKRATAEYAGKNPDSVLANAPKEKFNSRYADPNNPAASGSLISFVSGGRLIPGPHSRGLIGGVASVVGQAVRGERQGAEWEQYRNQYGGVQQYNDRYSRYYQGSSWRTNRSGNSSGPVSASVGAYKKLLGKNVLYLMVVNMPSEEEMTAAKAMADKSS